MAGSQCWQTIPTKLSLAQFEQFVLPHLNTGRVVRHRRWGCTGSSTTSCSCCTWDDSGRRCRSKGMPKVALKSTTRASIGRCGDGRPMVASTRFLRARCASFIRTGCLNSRSSTATARPLPRRRTATTFIGDAPEGVVLPDARAPGGRSTLTYSSMRCGISFRLIENASFEILSEMLHPTGFEADGVFPRNLC